MGARSGAQVARAEADWLQRLDAERAREERPPSSLHEGILVNGHRNEIGRWVDAAGERSSSN